MSSFNCFVVGLTGGIGSGKSTASQYFEQLGIQIVNADQVARDCVMPERPHSMRLSTILEKK